MVEKPQASHSRFVRRIRRRYAKELALLPRGVPSQQMIFDLVQQLKRQGYALVDALRVARQLVIERLVVLDVEEGVPLITVMHAMSDLAEIMLKISLQQAWDELVLQYGMPLKEDGAVCAFWIMGMGKLGGRELNTSSDIDLVYLYEEGGHTQGRKSGDAEEGKENESESCTNHEFFSFLAKKLFSFLGEVNEHGFVFRLDLDLRPNGKSGPMVVSLPMLKTYFHLQGRDWERFAWMKGRVVAKMGDDGEKEESLLNPLIRPFVYRRYLDFNLLESLRQTHALIQQQELSSAKYSVEHENNIKLSRGGIRELEFSAQLFQVVRGGQFPELRTESTQDALKKLGYAGLLTAGKVDELQDAYDFLRRVEHRIQYLDDRQTHVLPNDKADVFWIAQSLYPNKSDGKDKAEAQVTQQWVIDEFLAKLRAVQKVVATQFDDLLLSEQRLIKKAANKNSTKGKPPKLITEAGFEDLLPIEMRERVVHWSQSARVKGLKDSTKINLSFLVLRTGEWLEEGMLLDVGALRFLDWLDVILRRENYHAMLLERPLIHQRLLRLLERARWVLFYLKRYPSVIDELGSKKLYEQRFDAHSYEQGLHARRKALQETDEEDEEALLNVLRRAHHAELFQTLARDVEEYLTVEQVADDLSLLADVTLKVAMRWCWDYLKKKHREEPQLGVIAYGKYGGIELGYGGDLDIVFVYDDHHESAGEVYAGHVRKVIQWVSSKTAEGDLFEIDMELRPNGNSGLLVASLESFESYQLGRGSNTAWTWEHQALTRARCAVGSDKMVSWFEKIRQQVIASKRDKEALKKEILLMRERIRDAYPTRFNEVDIKHGVGAMLDIEFCVQYLVLGYAYQHAELVDDVGNIALLVRAQNAKVIPIPFGQQAADSYRLLREMQHRIRLDESAYFTQDELLAACEAGARLWREIFIPH